MKDEENQVYKVLKAITILSCVGLWAVIMILTKNSWSEWGEYDWKSFTVSAIFYGAFVFMIYRFIDKNLR